MGSQWPPSPRVEDEELALKNEITHNSELNNKKEAEEAPSRGTVDQYPIILDTKRGPESKRDYISVTDNEGESIRTQSSDDSYGPPTPPSSKAGGSKIHGSPKPNSTRSQSAKVTPLQMPLQSTRRRSPHEVGQTFHGFTPVLGVIYRE